MGSTYVRHKMYTAHPTRYKFEVYTLDGNKKPDLRRSFLRRMRLDLVNFSSIEEPKIQTEDCLWWNVILDSDNIDYYATDTECIVSFQSFHNDERIAVVRQYRNNNNG